MNDFPSAPLMQFACALSDIEPLKCIGNLNYEMWSDFFIHKAIESYRSPETGAAE